MMNRCPSEAGGAGEPAREATAGSGVGERVREAEVEEVEEMEEVEERVEEVEGVEVEGMEERVGEVLKELSSCQVQKYMLLCSGVCSSGCRSPTSPCAISSVYGDRFISTDSSFVSVLFLSLHGLTHSVLAIQGS